jgi:hypothetical protein
MVGNNAGTETVVTFPIRLVTAQAVPVRIVVYSSMRARSYDPDIL